MNPEQYRRAKAVFFEVCDAPASERARLLEECCAGDAELRANVEALLSVDPGEEADAGAFGPRPEAAVIDAVFESAGASSEPVSIAGTRVLRRLGEGGMGAVYECEQASPRRVVAVKLIRRGAASPPALRRFQVEAEALGRLRHPNIASLYGAGVGEVEYAAGGTERAAYLMMERVEGRPLSEYVREHRLGVEACVRLMIGVCDGVRHAHAMNVIHRDLKPGNILVEGEPGAPAPKILDFGIARIVGPEEARATLSTTPGQVLGTLSYMAPEQVAGDPRLVDTRSDVYALGVILYELLAGRPPLDVSEVSLAEAARIVQEVEPPGLGALAPELQGDLATIVGKAMRKAAEERYQSAGELAADLSRYLRSEPISARPATRLYVLRKFAGRNRALVASMGAAALALAVGGGMAAAGWLSARAANAELRTTVTQKARQLQRSEQVVRMMRNMLLSVKPMIARDRDTTLMREVLERAQKELDGGELKGQPEVEAEMRSVIAETYAALGDNRSALTQIELAMGPARSAPADADPVLQNIRRTYANILFDWGRVDDAAAELDALARIRRSAGQSGEAMDADILSTRAAIAARRGRSDESASLQLEALAIRRRVLGEKHPTIATTTGNLAGALQNLGRYDEALALLKECLEICEAMDPPALMHITIVRNNLGDLLIHMGRHAEAESVVRRGLEVAASIYQPEHQQLGLLQYTMGNALRGQGRHEEAVGRYREAARILATTSGALHVLASGARADAAGELVALKRLEEARLELDAARAAVDPAAENAVEAIKRCDEVAAELERAAAGG